MSKIERFGKTIFYVLVFPPPISLEELS